ncbi:MAG: hypothetical protein ACRDYC_04075, partial [Acidimicrobiales bacterium]
GEGPADAPERGSHLGLNGGQLSSFRRVEGGELELRVFNPTNSPTTVEIPGCSGRLVDLVGNDTGHWEGSIPLGAWEIALARLTVR